MPKPQKRLRAIGNAKALRAERKSMGLSSSAIASPTRREIPLSVKIEVLTQNAKIECYVCGKWCWLADCQWEHKIPVSQHAPTDDYNRVDNIGLICDDCHSKKTPHDNKNTDKMKRVATAKHAMDTKTKAKGGLMMPDRRWTRRQV